MKLKTRHLLWMSVAFVELLFGALLTIDHNGLPVVIALAVFCVTAYMAARDLRRHQQEL